MAYDFISIPCPLFHFFMYPRLRAYSDAPFQYCPMVPLRLYGNQCIASRICCKRHTASRSQYQKGKTIPAEHVRTVFSVDLFFDVTFHPHHFLYSPKNPLFPVRVSLAKKTVPLFMRVLFSFPYSLFPGRLLCGVILYLLQGKCRTCLLL